jgi:hypothetical protein
MLKMRMKQEKKLAKHLMHLIFLLPISSFVSDNLQAHKLTEEQDDLIPSEYGGGSLPKVILSYSRSCGVDHLMEVKL